MNLIDFWVTKIISEEYGKMYKLMNIDLEKEKQEIDKEDGNDDEWIEYLQDDGIKQVIEVKDMGGKRIETVYKNLSIGEKPYKIGDKGVY